MSFKNLVGMFFKYPDTTRVTGAVEQNGRNDNDSATVQLTINGTVYKREVESRYLLVDFIRHEVGLKGTHIGCEHGVCGACTVLLNGNSARSCLQFAAALDGAQITTIEGIAEDGDLHPVQQAFHELHAVQCGYCTPGFLLTSIEFLRSHANPTREDIRRALVNNVCRCTGYVNIVEAVHKAASQLCHNSSEYDREQT